MRDAKPKIIKYRGRVRTDKVGSECEFEFEVDARWHHTRVEEEAREAAFDLVEWSYEIVPQESQKPK